MAEKREFEGPDVGGALQAAALALGASPAELRYEVLDPGGEGFLGVGRRPARIAVVVGGDPQPEKGVEEEVQNLAAELVERMHFELKVTLSAEQEYLVVQLSGADRDYVLQDRAELLQAIQYLLNRIFSRKAGGRRVIVDCNGFRRRKEEELRQIAQRASEKARLTGVDQELGLMNPYERRVIHLEVAALEGVSTVSCGDGFMKRITIVPK